MTSHRPAADRSAGGAAIDQTGRPRAAAALVRWGLAAVLAVNLALLALSYLPQPRAPAGDEVAYRAAAERLADGRQARQGLLWPPLYGTFVAVLAGGGPLWPVQLAQLALLAATAWLIADLGRRLTGSRRAGWLAGLLTAGYPPLVAQAHYLWPEIVHLALWVAAVWIVARRPTRPFWLALLGVLLGLALLTKNLLLPFVPLLLAAVALADPEKADPEKADPEKADPEKADPEEADLEKVDPEKADRESTSAPTAGGRRAIPLAAALARPLLVAAIAAATVAPVVVRNGLLHDAWLISDSSRFNLWVGLTDRYRTDYREGTAGREYRRYLASGDSFEARNRVLEGKIRDLVARRGALPLLGDQLARQPFRLFDKDSLLTSQLPGGGLARRGKGYRGLPRLPAELLRGACYALYGLLLVAAAGGLVRFPPRRRRWVWLVLLFLGGNLLLFLLVHVKARYRIQLLPFLFLYAGGWLDLVWRRLAGEDPPGAAAEGGGWRRWATIGLAALLLALAFAGPALDRWLSVAS